MSDLCGGEGSGPWVVIGVQTLSANVYRRHVRQVLRRLVRYSPELAVSRRKRRAHGLRGCSKFAYDEANSYALGASHVREHALIEIRKLVVAAHLEPDKLVRILLQSLLDDDKILS